MFTNLFGTYLIQKGIISTQQYETIKAEQSKTRVKLGLIAVAEKLMTQEQADEINKKQATVDRRFGDIAVEMGILNKAQVTRLLNLQGNPYIQFSQTVTDMGIMTLDQIDQRLEEFRKEKGFTLSDLEAIKSGDIDSIIPLFLAEELPWNIAELIAVMIRTINRLITTDILIKDCKMVSTYDTKEFAMQSMTGDLNGSTVLSGSKEGILTIAEGFAKEKFGQIGEETLDSLGEFINIVNGLFATAISHDQVKVVLTPPHLSEAHEHLSAEKMCVLPLAVDGNAIDLVISVGSIISF